MTTKVAEAIAHQEGYFVIGSLPQRNNNPGDLRHGNAETHPANQPDAVGSFPTPALGWTALERQLVLDSTGARANWTVQQLINSYAPPSENDTAKYLAFVCLYVGCAPTTLVSVALKMQSTTGSSIMTQINPVQPVRPPAVQPPAPPPPTPTLPKPGFSPSDSTTASGAAGALAALTVFILGQKGITFPAGMEAAIAVILSTIGGYLPPSGRR